MFRTPEQQERHKIANHKWYLTHKGQSLQINREWREKLKYEILAHYCGEKSPHCVQCGEGDIDVLCVDHINGGGNRHRKRLKVDAGGEFYSWLRKQGYPEGYQALCANCNLRKGIAARRASSYRGY
ncbi:unnamed protein product [marine sediment metagenome]|uniref:Uncharacterized protein n=1 Tax=marine sediment metagenome TaxID=412755 RepID=X1C4W4_9ZZZZ